MKTSNCCWGEVKSVWNTTQYYICVHCKQPCDATEFGIDPKKVTAHNVNQTIQKFSKEEMLDTEDISDWYHSFWELYKHRFHLYIALCKSIQEWNRSEYGFSEYTVIRSRIHKDWLNVWADWKMFLLMMVNDETWEQISYHLDNEYWEKCDFAKTELIATREWDGHTSEDVLDRLLKI